MPRKTWIRKDAVSISHHGFNEAAARCRGKHAQDFHRPSGPVAASMRPRPDAAENSPLDGVVSMCSTGFNEAAARCRGKRTGPRLVSYSGSVLQ